MRKPGLRVLNVIAEDRVGGPQLRILRVARALRERGVDTVVAIPRGQGGFGKLLSEAEIPFHHVPGLRRIRATTNPLTHLGWLVHLGDSIASLIGIIKKEKIALVHQNDVTHIQGAIAGRLAGAKVVWHINGMTYPLVWKSFKPLVYAVPHAVVASSQAMGKDYFGANGGLLARPFHVLYPPIEPQRYEAAGDGRTFRSELDIPVGCPLIGMVGNLYPTKGHLYFVQAAAKIKEQFPDARFVIVGQRFDTRRGYSAQLAGEVQRLGLSKALSFTGFREDVAGILGSLDVLVHPSLSESFGMVVAEGLAAGTPVVATAVGGVSEIVVHNESGILVPPRDTDAIARGVMSLLKDPNFAGTLGAQGKARVNQLFSVERCAAEHEKLYRSVLSDSAASMDVSGQPG